MWVGRRVRDGEREKERRRGDTKRQEDRGAKAGRRARGTEMGRNRTDGERQRGGGDGARETDRDAERRGQARDRDRGRERRRERGGPAAGWTAEKWRKERSPSHLTSAAAAPQAQLSNLRGTLGAGPPSLTALSGQPWAPRAKLGLSCQHPGAWDSCHPALHLPPAT